MENNLEQRLQKYAKKRERRKVWKKILSVLSVVVVFCTTYALILPAITQERETFCNIEEHIHSESCLTSVAEEKTIVCKLAEEEGHSHFEECYSENLICPEEENHIHSEECYSEETLVCEKAEEHLHSEECYEKVLFCELEEKEGHAHSEECYVSESSECIIPEHSHSLACYADLTAEIETEEQWTAAFAGMERSEADSENILAIVKSQLGYHESVKNYIVAEDGETIFGRTRFGEWFEEPYAEWNLLFAGFCIDYAETEIPFDPDIEKWIELLSDPETDIYIGAKEHKPLPGDLVFISLENNEKADAVGFVYEILENEIKIIAGDMGDCVQVIAFSPESEQIIGYGKIAVPSPYLCEKEEHIHKERCFDEKGNIICEMDEHSHSEECLDKTEKEIPEETPEYLCGFDEHIHGEGCFDENEELLCKVPEHAHSEECIAEKAEEEYICGCDEHEHSEECYDEQQNLICEIPEHVHTESCFDPYNLLTEEEKTRIENVISMIEELPTYEEIEAKIVEFEDAEDYEGEEAWLSELYQQVGYAYKYYSALPEEHKAFVTNAEKLLELEFIWSMAVLIEIEVGETVEYSTDMFSSGSHYVIYTQSENGYFAIDETGNAVSLNVDSEGIITAGINDKDEVLWNFTNSRNEYTICNKNSNTRYLYPSGSAVTGTRSNRSTLVESSGGVKIKYGNEYISFNPETQSFGVAKTEAEAAVFSFGLASAEGDIYIWFDGTCGGLDYLSGSENTLFTVSKGGKLVLPDEWKTPSRYHYRVQGWYDIVNKKYYLPGAEVVAEGNTVFYPDWVPYSYDIGQYNAQASNTVSTNQFITTKVFDFTPLYNANFSSVNVTVSATGHSETWTLSDKTQFVFRDNSTGKLSAPNGSTDRNTPNEYTNSDPNQEEWSDEKVGEKIFGTGNGFDPATGTGILGKNYLGTGDFLFQYCNDPNNKEYYGYYYYDSDYHAASYNRSAQRFYVYNYLSSAEGGGAASFLPLNSPYVNTNGRTVGTYSDNGEYNQYVGTTHYVYDGGNGVSSEYWFAIQSDVNFFLSDKPGNLDSEGKTVNRGVNGEELVFNFSGDDDVWVFVDGKLVLDIGGIHQAVDGHINFSTGEVVVDGRQQDDVKYLEGGDHVLTIYYLERGAGGSNCKIKFNISSRYGLRLLKEDVLTREMLNGAEFTVYTNMACTKEAKLWTSKEAYEAKEDPRSAFTVTNGEASFWGLAAGNTYYIRETKFPTNGNYGTANGIIVVKLDNEGAATFDVIAEADSEESGISAGFTVHGFKIDVENHAAYLIATNSKEDYGTETTSVTVKKKWVDETPVDHSKDSVTVYILANGFRIQETTLSANNNWTYTWKNLPLNGENKQPVKYTVEEGTVPGYVGTVSELTDTEIETTKTVWGTVDAPQDGKVHLIKASNGYLAAGSSGFYWISSEETAKASSEARWVIKKDGTTRWNFENEAGYNIYLYNTGSRTFRVAQTVPGSNANDDLEFNNKRIVRSNYYFGSVGTNGRATASKYTSDAINFTLYTETTTTSTETVKIDGIGYLITNTKVDEKETVSIRINKEWVTTNAAGSDYLYYKVNFKLFEDEKDTGMSKEVTLQNNWTAVFENLPKYDSEGKEIKYVIKEEFFADGWSTEYGEMIETGENSYEITVTNICHLNYMLPSTGGGGNIISIVGGILVLGAGSAVIYRQTHKKRRKEDSS